jgi:hypothetical protein
MDTEVEVWRIIHSYQIVTLLHQLMEAGGGGVMLVDKVTVAGGRVYSL